MALFYPSRRRRVIIMQQPRLPSFLRHLQVLCNNYGGHPLPVAMKFIAEATSDQGWAMAVYACPYAGCSCRQGWVQDRLTGRPRRLWAGMHNGR